MASDHSASHGGRRKGRRNAQKKKMLAKVSPNTIPGALHTIIRLLPIVSIHLRATRVKMKFVPETMSPTAVGLLNPICLKSVAE